MPRTAQGSATRPSSDRTAVELLDRTGIVAASLPRRRRAAADELPEAEPVYTRPPVCDQDLRPKSVVIRRRARAWLGSGAAVLLVAAGWLAGGLLGGGLPGPAPADDVAQVGPRPAVAAAPAPVPAPQPVSAPSTPAVTPPPKTVYVPVPAAKQPHDDVRAEAKPEPKKSASQDEARVDLPSSSVTPSTDPVQAWVHAAESMVQQYQYRVDTPGR